MNLIILFVATIHSKIMFQCLILSFDLFVCLKMKNNAESSFRFQMKTNN